MSYKWLRFGEFEFADQKIVFKGKVVEIPKEGNIERQALVGRAVCDQKSYGGKISVDVTFDYQVTRAQDSYPVTLEIAFFEASTIEHHMLVAGIGGNFGLFSIREWDNRDSLDPAQKGWKEPLARGGWIGEIQARRPYNICVQIEPSRITLFIENIQVATSLIRFPVIGSYIGLFCQSPELVTLENFKIEQYWPSVFVAMPFSDPYNDLYSHVFEPVCSRCELTVYRTDKTYESGLVIAEIIQKIVQSHIIVAEITPNPPNPNVYYEVGFAHALGKPVILVADRNCAARLPFDVSPFKVLFYENTISGKETILRDLVGHLNAILPRYEPIGRYYKELKAGSRITD